MPTKALLLLLLAVGRSACFIASSPWASRAPKVLLTPRTPSPPQLQLADGPQELPSKELLKAIATCKGTATAADISAASSLDIGEARRQLLVLARLVGAELQVSEDGELLFVFDEPGALRRSVRASSVRARLRDAWSSASPPLFWLLRASFGLGLIASITITTAAIAALSSSSKDDRSSSSSSMGTSVARLWGPSPFDFLYYSTRPYGYYGYYEPTGEKGFLQSCFSLLFGDGNPNHALEQRTAAATAALIRANGGAVTAEQLAPLLAPDLDPEIVEEELNRPGAPLREDWVLPVLLQFGGEPVVTEDGDLIYIFPELMATAAPPPATAGGGAAATGTSGALVNRRGQLDYAALAAFAERPMAWRPAVGDRVVIGAVAQRSRRRDDRAAATYTGQSGVVVSDDRDGLPFGVAFDGSGRAAAFYALDEVLPFGADADGLALQELPQRFSTAPPAQLALAGGLGAANLFAVLYLGRMLAAVAGYPVAALGSSGPLIGALRKLYVPLLTYATGFIAVPAVRAVVNKRRNRAIEARNAMRSAWGRALAEAPPASSPSLSSPTGSVAPPASGGGGLRARLRRKLAAAKALRPRLRRLERGGADAVYSTSRDIAESRGSSPPATSLPGDGFDDFDARLAAADDAPPRDPA